MLCVDPTGIGVNISVLFNPVRFGVFRLSFHFIKVPNSLENNSVPGSEGQACCLRQELQIRCLEAKGKPVVYDRSCKFGAWKRRASLLSTTGVANSSSCITPLELQVVRRGTGSVNCADRRNGHDGKR